MKPQALKPETPNFTTLHSEMGIQGGLSDIQALELRIEASALHPEDSRP